MVNCKNCGVELEGHMNFCPLCGVPVLNKDVEWGERLIREKQAGTMKLKNEVDMLNRTQKKRFFWEVISIILVAGVISTIVLNLIISGTITWSVYVLIGGLTFFGYATVFSFVIKWIKVLSSILIISMLSLLLVDLTTRNIAWSLQLGLPLLIAVGVIVFLLVKVIKIAREKGFNLIAYIFLAVAILSISVEGILSLYIREVLRLNWSLIVFFSTLPVAAILLYFHFKLRKGTDLRKFFHI
jgi:hypothetical protein